MSTPGRPKLDSDIRRDVIMTLRVSASEHEELEAAAKAEKINLSKWAREILLTHARNPNSKVSEVET